MSTSHDHACADLTPAQDVEVAERAIAEGDLGHAALHVACALAADPLDASYHALFDKLYARADDPLALVPFESGTSYAIVALRANVLARRGQHGEALDLLFRIAQVRPEVPYLTWARDWLRDDRIASSVDAAALADPVGRWVIERRGSDGIASLRVGLPALERLARSHPASIDLRYWFIAALRKIGDLDRASDEARSLYEAHPSWRAALAIAMVLRERGDVDGAVEAFRMALSHDPDDIGVRLDLGDMLCGAGRVDEGLGYYDEVLAREPTHEWARPSALFQRALRGDSQAAEQLRLMTFNEPENRRARELADRLPAGPTARTVVAAAETRPHPPTPAKPTVRAGRAAKKTAPVAVKKAPVKKAPVKKAPAKKAPAAVKSGVKAASAAKKSAVGRKAVAVAPKKKPSTPATKKKKSAAKPKRRAT